MSTSAEIAAAAPKFVTAAEKAHAIVNGPASGTGSLVSTESGDIPTHAKQAADYQAAIDALGGISGRILQTVTTTQTADFSTAATIPYDATIPQSSEGVEYITQAITPISATSKLEIEIQLMIGGSAGGIIIAPMFKDSGADAIFTGVTSVAGGSTLIPFIFKHIVDSGTTAARTFKVRLGSNGITVYVNRNSGTADLFGASVSSRITIKEIE